MADIVFQRFSDRYFQLSPLYAPAGWYFKARGISPMGPYFSRVAAEMAAHVHRRRCVETGDCGGRRTKQRQYLF